MFIQCHTARSFENSQDMEKELANVFPLISNLDQYYPSISSWFEGSFSKGLSSGKNVLITAQNKEGALEGVALAKNTDEEVKIQCLRISPTSTNTGLGIVLMDRMIEHLECQKPFCTVSEEMLHQYSRMFVKRYGFTLDNVIKGVYRPRKLEYCFNGSGL